MIIPHSQGGDFLRMTCKKTPETQSRFMKLTQIQNPDRCCHSLKHPLSPTRDWVSESDANIPTTYCFVYFTFVYFWHITVKQTKTKLMFLRPVSSRESGDCSVSVHAVAFAHLEDETAVLCWGPPPPQCCHWSTQTDLQHHTQEDISLKPSSRCALGWLQECRY